MRHRRSHRPLWPSRPVASVAALAAGAGEGGDDVYQIKKVPKVEVVHAARTVFLQSCPISPVGGRQSAVATGASRSCPSLWRAPWSGWTEPAGASRANAPRAAQSRVTLPVGRGKGHHEAGLSLTRRRCGQIPANNSATLRLYALTLTLTLGRVRVSIG